MGTGRLREVDWGRLVDRCVWCMLGNVTVSHLTFIIQVLIIIIINGKYKIGPARWLSQ